MIDRTTLRSFVTESNRIEGITGVTDGEIAAHEQFLKLSEVQMGDLIDFVSTIQPNARLRDQVGLNVRVGTYLPPLGSPVIRSMLDALLMQANDTVAEPWHVHLLYESLHPFTDGNGRSGRVLWLWMMERRGRPIYTGFLHAFYYQTLQYANKERP